MKKVLSVILVLTLSLGIVGCGSNKEANKTEGKANSKTELRILTRTTETNPQGKVFKDILKQFEKDNEGVVIIDESQGDEASYNNKLKTDIASGTLPHIFRIGGLLNLGEYIKNGMLMNVESIYEEDKTWGAGIPEGSKEYYRIPGFEGLYGIPMEAGMISIFYNQAIFDKVGVKYPETWDDFKDVIKKFRESNITPISLGAKSAYMAGHLHNQIFYKYMGIQGAKDLGARKIKWTDKDVLQTLQYVADLRDLKAFDDGVVGNDDNIAITNFLNGEAAMIITGPWNIGKFTSDEQTEYVGKIKIGKFPHFKDRAQFKDDDMQIVAPYMLNGELEGKDKEYAIELVKKLTSKEAAKRFAEEAQYILPRSDVSLDADKISPLFKDTLKISATSKRLAVDIFDYDPIASMSERTRNSIIGILIGNTPEQAAKEIQAEIDKNK